MWTTIFICCFEVGGPSNALNWELAAIRYAIEAGRKVTIGS